MSFDSTSPIVQTGFPPIELPDECEQWFATVKQTQNWDSVSVFFDVAQDNTVLLLIEEDSVVAACRFCLTPTESVHTVRQAQEAGPIEVRCYQAGTFDSDAIRDIHHLAQLWNDAHGQRAELGNVELRAFFERAEDKSLEDGRGKGLNKAGREQVFFEAHGRCMFEGCGEDLTIDPLTGQRGKFSILAHNVAASERGTRGIRYLSSQLADDPANVLLVCDVHHRLVDTVAKADYPAATLTRMRETAVSAAARLLDGLSREPILANSIAWPIRGQVTGSPSALDIAQSFEPINARLRERCNEIEGSSAYLRDVPENELWQKAPALVNSAVSRLELQMQASSGRSGLFAIGPMPPLIALGARLGNKSGAIPMLRHRDLDRWWWPAEQSRGRFYELIGMDQLGENEEEVVVELALTYRPPAMQNTVDDLSMASIRVEASPGLMGNSSLSHPEDGAIFRQHMQETFHKLSSHHGVKRLHILPCASNAACVFFGQSFDNYHPSWRIYDFVDGDELMSPRLEVVSQANSCSVQLPKLETEKRDA